MSSILISIDGLGYTRANGKLHKKLEGKTAICHIVDDKDNIQYATMLNPVKSSNITHVGFIDAENSGTLILLFSNGGLYFYTTASGIISGVFMTTVNSASVGRHVNETIKKKYPYENMGKV